MRWPHHPFPVTCTFRRCILVNFAVDPDRLAAHLPAGLEPNVVADRSFVAVVIGQMDRMRPVGLPRAAGITYNQIVYRAVIRRHDTLGVHFLRSDADNRLMCAVGERMSFFRFHHSAISIDQTDDALDIQVTTPDLPGADISARFDLSARTRHLPETSRFDDLNVAREHLVELFTAYDRNTATGVMESVSIDRDPWDVQVLPLIHSRFEFMEAGPIFDTDTARLDSVLAVSDVRYRWNRLQREACDTPHVGVNPGAPSSSSCLQRA